MNISNIPDMCFSKNGIRQTPISSFKVDEDFIIGIYKGPLSDFDILVKYKQKLSNGEWSRIRTPKHIHWTVDILLKMESYKCLTKEFVKFFLNIWEETKPLSSEDERQSIDLELMINQSKEVIKKYEELDEYGEYSVKFLILLAKLLMLQEKTNLENAYMFKNLLDALLEGKDLFKILSIASHTGRR